MRMSLRDHIQEYDRRAVAASVALVSRAGADDLSRPTPCAGWDLGQLIEHMTAQHRGFAAAAHGRGGEPGVWEAAPAAGEGLLSAYAAAADRVLAAFAADGVLDRPFRLPEISAEIDFPGEAAVSFHFVDYVVHSWDVAKSLGAPVDFDSDVLRGALAIARRVPDDDSRRRPGAAFAPSVPADAGASALERVVSLLGRPPTWGS